MYKCNDCKLDFKNRSQLANHFRWKHKQCLIFKCNKCNKEITDKSGLTIHEKFCTGVKEKKNNICPKCNFTIKTNYKKHVVSCNGLGPRRLRTKHRERVVLTKENIEIIRKQYDDNVPLKIIRQQNKFSKLQVRHALKGYKKRSKSDVIKRSHKEGRMCRLQFHESFAEKFFNDFLQKSGYKLGLDYIREYRVSYYRIDFFFQNLNIAIEVDGSQHYTYNHQIEIDKRKDQLLNNLGIKVIRLPWKVVCNESKNTLNEVLDIIKNKNVDEFNNKQKIKLADLLKKRKETKKKQKQRKKNLPKKYIEKLIIALNKCIVYKTYMKRMNDLNNVDLKKWGTISELSNLWNVSHTQVRRYIEKHCLLEKSKTVWQSWYMLRSAKP